MLGGWVGTRMGWGRVEAGEFNPRSIGIATLGAIVLLVASRLIFRRGRR
jgi:uncharacterized membrane protein YeaQ/YmgE (transglycosylase-associated protein family)